MIRCLSIWLLCLLSGSLIAQEGSSVNPHGEIRWDCMSCHTSESWTELKSPPDFRHADTGFLLSGAHRELDCMTCHESPQFAAVGSACADCHTDVHKAEFGLDCATCHTPVSWQNQRNHLELHAARGFPLTGAHAIADCQSCHVNEQRNEFSGLAVSCFSCHTSDFMQTSNPSHSQAQFSLNCLSCHQPIALKWDQNVSFQHTQAFELRGAHIAADCMACHSETFTGTSADCFTCHQNDYQTAQSPDHAAFGFPTDCVACHNENGWRGTEFDHLQVSGFALNGAHNTILCIDCHVDNQINGLPRDCISCHQENFSATTNPPHVANNFPTDCLNCHSETAWQPASFDHAQTNFPLTGAHISLDCIACHSSGYTNTPVLCYSCHQSDYEGVGDPNHVQNNFSLECLTCHTTDGWQPATFDHAQTNFPLTGAHISLDCIACHSSGYTNTPVLCISCHQSDYQNTTNPPHAAAGFPTDCMSCHNTTRWEDSNFNHDQQYFPIYSGRHEDEWSLCVDCHVDPGNFARFECIFCHAHTQPEMDDRHDDVPGYVYQSSACYACHPNGEELKGFRGFPQKLDRIRR